MIFILNSIFTQGTTPVINISFIMSSQFNHKFSVANFYNKLHFSHVWDNQSTFSNKRLTLFAPCWTLIGNKQFLFLFLFLFLFTQYIKNWLKILICSGKLELLMTVWLLCFDSAQVLYIYFQIPICSKFISVSSQTVINNSSGIIKVLFLTNDLNCLLGLVGP
jgi:hypothetical protein